MRGSGILALPAITQIDINLEAEVNPIIFSLLQGWWAAVDVPGRKEIE